jgi:hypothetical protein
MTDPVTIGWNSNKWVKDGNTKMVTLYTPFPQATYSMHDSATSANYQVPVGKKFILLNISCSVGRNGSNVNMYMEFYRNTIPDSLTGASMVAQSYAGVNSQGQAGIQNQNMPTFIEFAAGEYVTSKFEYHGVATAIGIETNV